MRSTRLGPAAALVLIAAVAVTAGCSSERGGAAAGDTGSLDSAAVAAPAPTGDTVTGPLRPASPGDTAAAGRTSGTTGTGPTGTSTSGTPGRESGGFSRSDSGSRR